MKRAFPIFLLFLLTAFSLPAQKLDFLGLTGIHFDMSDSEMDRKVVMMDSTSVYKDTAIFIKNSRCLTYFRQGENLQLTGFTATALQYQFCDHKLAYVFVDVIGEKEIDKTLAQLKLTFTKLGCRGKTLSECTQIDSYAKGMRIIINIDRKKQTMNFVLIPKAAAR
ncbi:hypothetical protein BH11BAC7_BH11BAC7_29250 [soil metagenome]